MKEDIIWLDYARVIGIFLVILGHVEQHFPSFLITDLVLKDVWHIIYLFHMPLFFIISGYLFSGKKNDRVSFSFIYGNIRMLLVSYLIYQIAYIPLILKSHSEEICNGAFWVKVLLGIVMGDGYDTPYSIYICLPCWFIICIIQLRVLFGLVTINQFSGIILSLFSIVFLWFRKYFGLDLFFCLDSTVMAIPYFLFGYWLKSENKSFDKLSYGYSVLSSIALLAILLLILCYNGPAQMNGPSYGKYVVFCYLAGIAVSLMVFGVSGLFSRLYMPNKFLKLISRNTLFIIFFHFVLVKLLNGLKVYKIINIVSDNWIWTLFWVIVLSVGILFLSYLMIRTFVNKYPIVFGKKRVLWK
ncbi:acyltransferase family protein [Phocaeicola sartorii]|uniref:acyltransferase family protein n=1 Tax=Phocaeicola sartorii TaxID=671267 RepID=UPI00258FB2B8|nr:acyltransferase family protein [Phocaeicola sartorii]